MIQHILDNTVLKMSQHILSLLITYMGAVQISLSSLSTTFVVDRNNSTFEIVLQPPRECPEQYYHHKARHGEFFLNDGRDVTKESRKLCIKCSKCLDGIEVVRHCTAHRDVLCGSKCVQSGFRFDEGTRSCQHEKVLDEGYNHEELRKWLAESEQEKSVVSEVGSTPKPTHIDTQTTDVTEHRHQGLRKTVLGTSQTSTTPPTRTSDESGRLFDEISSDGEEISDEQQTGENLPRPAADDYPATLQQLLFIVLLTLLVFTLLLYAFAAVRKFRPGLLSRMFVRQRQLPAPVTIEVSSGRVPRPVTVLTSLRTSAHRDGSRDEPQPPGDVSCSDGSYDDTDDYDDDTSDSEEKSLLVDGNLNLPSSHDCSGDDIRYNEENCLLGDGNPNSPLSHVGNDDDIGNNAESVVLDEVENDSSNHDSVEMVEPSIQLRHSLSDYHVVVHDSDNIKCDVKGSSDGNGSPRSRQIGTELGREEDKTIDEVSKREPSGNEDNCKGENCLSEEVEEQPCSEKETPFIDTVVPGDDLDEDVFDTVSKENNIEVVDCGFGRSSRDNSPLDSSECLNATDESNEANGEKKIKVVSDVLFVEDAAVINQSQSLWNLVGGLGKAFINLFKKAGGVKRQSCGVANSPHEGYRRRSSSTHANWMSEFNRPPVSLCTELGKVKVCQSCGHEKRDRYLSELKGKLSVTEKSYEIKTEVKIEDTTVPIVENTSSTNAPQSPRTLEAGVDLGVDDQVDVKHLDSDADRILTTTECEISHEVGNQPTDATRRRSSSTSSMAVANGRTRLRSYSTSGDLNPSENKMTSDTKHGGRQVEMKNTRFYRDHTLYTIQRLDLDGFKKKTKRENVAKASKLESITTMERHQTMGVTHEQDERSKSASRGQLECRCLSTKDSFWMDCRFCYDEARKQTMTRVSMLEDAFAVNAPQSRRYFGPGCDQGAGVNRTGFNAGKRLVTEFETGEISHVMTRIRRNSTGTRVNSMSRAGKMYTPSLMRSLEESVPVDKRRPLSLPIMAYFDKTSSPDTSTTEGTKLTLSPLSANLANFHQVERNLNHRLDQQAC